MIAYFGPGGPNFTPDQILRDRASPNYFGKSNVIVTFRGGGVVVLDVL